MGVIIPATKLVIPAAAERRAGIQKRHCDYWITAFTRMTGWWISVAQFNCRFNNHSASSGLITGWISLLLPSGTGTFHYLTHLIYEPKFRIWFEFGLIFHDIKRQKQNMEK
jgi:hypothetical protein